MRSALPHSNPIATRLRRHDIRNSYIQRVVKLHVDGAGLTLVDRRKEVAQAWLLKPDQISRSSEPTNNVSIDC